MMKAPIHTYTFNSPLEAGLRSLEILSFAYPVTYDIQKLILFDYLVVHTGDVGGPQSLHPPLPQRTKEILVRRGLVQSGLLVMMSRNLVERVVDNNGITYRAGELSETFLESLSAPYFVRLRQRSSWIVKKFGDLQPNQLREFVRAYFSDWIIEFQTVREGLQY